MAYKDAAQRYAYNNSYTAQNYTVFRVVTPKPEAPGIRAAAQAAGQSVSAYILQAVKERMQRDRAGEG